MSKSTVTRLFIGSLVAVAAGGVLAIVAVSLAMANDLFVMAGADIVGVRWSPLAWSLVGLGIVSGLAIAGGMIAGLVSWIGALLNTWRLPSKTWFAVLLLLGIFNVGFLAMVAYLIAGPDGRRPDAPQPALAPVGA
jgi:MFS family permease